MFNVRWMEGRDLPYVLMLSGQVLGKDPRIALRHLQRMDKCACVVLLRYYDVVGYLLYKHEKDRVTIMHVAVSPEYQRKGGGTDMVKFVLDGYSKAKTIKPIEVMLREDASDAQSFFRAAGFKVAAIKKQHFKNGDDGYLMRKVPERIQVDQPQV